MHLEGGQRYIVPSPFSPRRERAICSIVYTALLLPHTSTVRMHLNGGKIDVSLARFEENVTFLVLNVQQVTQFGQLIGKV